MYNVKLHASVIPVESWLVTSEGERGKGAW